MIYYEYMIQQGYVKLPMSQYLAPKGLQWFKNVIKSCGQWEVEHEVDDVFLEFKDGYKVYNFYVRHKEGKELKLELCLVTAFSGQEYPDSGQAIIPIELNDEDGELFHKDQVDVVDYDEVVAHINKLIEYNTCAQINIIGSDFFITYMPVIEGDEIVECQETGLKIYKSMASIMEMCDTPWNEPEDRYFVNYEAYDAYCGRIYSKDFAYFECEGCGRVICEQNPSNGWHVQYRMVSDCELICLRCYEKMILADGIDIDWLDHDIPGMFMDTNKIEEAGWTKYESYFINGSNQEEFKNECRELYHNQYKYILIEYDSLGLGGGEGHVTVWTKPRD